MVVQYCLITVRDLTNIFVYFFGFMCRIYSDCSHVSIFLRLLFINIEKFNDYYTNKQALVFVA